MGGVSLSFEFVDKYVRFAKPEYVQVYIYVKYCVEKNGVFPTAEEVSSALDIRPAKIEFVFEYWTSQGQFVNESGGYSLKETELDGKKKMSRTAENNAKRDMVKRVRSMKPSYSQEEIDAVASGSKQISDMFFQAEKILDKVLTASDMELLFSFNDWLGLPVEVILMLLVYAAKKGKTTKRYLETVAIDWAEKGIDTFEMAEAYVSELEEIDGAESSVRRILGIYDRGLTATEKKYIKLWTSQMRIPEELVALAYDKTVEYTGKLSWSYMDKMLQNWTESGFKTVDDVKAADEKFYENGRKSDNKKVKAGKFNNYDDSNKNDYAELEEQILDMMLDND